MRVLSANFDGSTPAAQDSLALWLRHAEYDVLLMQETHRGFGSTASEWEAKDWLFVSSPDPSSRFAGVAIAVRKALVRGGVVRFAEIEEHSEILTYFQALFGTSTRKRSLKQDLKVILDQGEVEASLAKLGKAVPANGAPSSAWKYCRQVLSCPLLEAFQSETIAGYPDLWANCCLKLIPKPQKGH
eukprot:s6455_g4.t1